MNALRKLLSIAGAPLGDLSAKTQDVLLPDLGEYGKLGQDLADLIRERNGFYAFESALHLLPATTTDPCMTLPRWNSFETWRYAYGDLALDSYFFAEDAFGGQFCLHKDAIYTFDPETGSIGGIAASLEEWAKRLLDDYEVLTGWPLMRAWQEKYGPIPVGKRLIAKQPFVLGGEFELNNLISVNAIEGMRYRAKLAVQIKDLPEGAQIEWDVIAVQGGLEPKLGEPDNG